MKLPPDVTFLEVPRLLIWRPRGVLNEALVNKLTAFIGEEELIFGKPFDRFFDMSALDAIDLNFEYVFRVALHRRLSYAGHPSVKSAFLATTPEATHLAKLHAMLTDHSPLHVAVFSDIKAAADWLAVPREVLTPG
jgi:hypothetical protein